MRIALLGYGTVGTQVVRILDEKKEEALKKLEISAILLREGTEKTDERMVYDMKEILQDPKIDTVVECIGGDEPAFSYVLSCLKNGKHVVTSNKKMLALHYEELTRAAKENHVQLRYEAAVGGGIPWICTLEQLNKVDRITAVRGILNGTTNYILDRMRKEKMDLDRALKQAQALGYAEADPTDDLCGYDVRYKVALSSAAAFHTMISPDSIPTLGIRNVSAQDMEQAEAHGYVLKLLGKAEPGRARVLPCFVKMDSVFASIPLNYNAVCATCRDLQDTVLIGQGAGGAPTAHAVVSDLVRIFEKEEMGSAVMAGLKEDKTCHVYYLRADGVCAQDLAQMFDAHCGLSVPMTLKQAMQIIGEDGFLAEVEE